MPSFIDPEFDDLLEQLRATSEALDLATSALQQRVWMFPPLNGWSGDPQDITGMNDAFDRTNLNLMYDSALHTTDGSGHTGDCAASKIMVDYIAVAERGFRTRWASRIRSMMHAAGRRMGHGDPINGLYAGSVRPYIQSIIDAAAIIIPPPVT
jgi:hypothetical protein